MPPISEKAAALILELIALDLPDPSVSTPASSMINGAIDRMHNAKVEGILSALLLREWTAKAALEQIRQSYHGSNTFGEINIDAELKAAQTTISDKFAKIVEAVKKERLMEEMRDMARDLSESLDESFKAVEKESVEIIKSVLSGDGSEDGTATGRGVKRTRADMDDSDHEDDDEVLNGPHKAMVTVKDTFAEIQARCEPTEGRRPVRPSDWDWDNQGDHPAD